ncbi:UDP-N-acetylglucosamine 2-epimerase [Candidatus Bipolaricaulota bacterium]|nr:UDP-N-acetylglucosamine 2-epimerase [Candidatus Bipolaricaulota bacterium]HHR85532.1 hypothetical protein [Candidatus Acetothermia bacterium]
MEVTVCVTGQQRNLLDQTLSVLQLVLEYDLDVMIANQSLFYTTSVILSRIESVLHRAKLDLVLVQGDAQMTFCGHLPRIACTFPLLISRRIYALVTNSTRTQRR